MYGYGKAPRYRPVVQGSGGSQPAQAPGFVARPRWPHLDRALQPPRHDASGRDPPPGAAGGGESRGYATSRAREAALPQSGAATGDLRAVDRQVREAAPQSAVRTERTAGKDR